MDINQTQFQRKAGSLSKNLEALGDSYASPRQTMIIVLSHQAISSHLTDFSDTFLTIREGTNLYVRRQLNYFMLARQLLSIHFSKPLLMKHGEKCSLAHS